jgi:hypothetical protein
VGEGQHKRDFLIIELSVVGTGGAALRRHPEASIEGEPDRALDSVLTQQYSLVQPSRVARSEAAWSRHDARCIAASGVTQRSRKSAECGAPSISTEATPTVAPSRSASNRWARNMQFRQYCSGCVASSVGGDEGLGDS